MSRGLLIAAPGSGAGKTTVTLALLRLLSRRGTAVRGAKSGPDYIDPRFHEAACGAPCPNLDAWAMRPERIRALASAGPQDFLIVEGAMGLFDGAPPDGRGAAADLAKLLELPVILVVNASHMAQSVAALVEGFAGHDPGVRIAGVILNNVGSDRHEAMLRSALAPLRLPVLAALRRDAGLALPSRHLGLVQAEERADLDDFLERAADRLEAVLDLDGLLALAAPVSRAEATPQGRMRPPAQAIAVARDRAFAFAYPHLLEDWRAAGAEIRFFSPLQDEPAPQAGFIYLPGGYPELHAGRLAAADKFMSSIRNAAHNTVIYGECGGYMMLGDALTDAAGATHRMLGLLPLETSFATRRLHLGYRALRGLRGPFQGRHAGHEFHYASIIRQGNAPALFAACDAEGQNLPDMGLSLGNVHGSFAHLIDAV